MITDLADLSDLVVDDAILLGVEASDAAALISEMADALVEAGMVGEGYGDRCLERERTDPTGLETIGACIAIPHAELAEGDTPAVAIARPRNPVTFGAMAEEGTVDAAVVLMLALPGGEAHIEALGQVVELGQDPVRMRAIMNATGPDEVRNALGEETKT
ncbi:MAG: hypothetical protein GEU79_16865 [Acidimicrobiia bacterium]|nr:hypothetical protein [Acidimicrobiia bacterium]